jgi:hypothetical protein
VHSLESYNLMNFFSFHNMIINVVFYLYPMLRRNYCCKMPERLSKMQICDPIIITCRVASRPEINEGFQELNGNIETSCAEIRINRAIGMKLKLFLLLHKNDEKHDYAAEVLQTQ